MGIFKDVLALQTSLLSTVLLFNIAFLQCRFLSFFLKSLFNSYFLALQGALLKSNC